MRSSTRYYVFSGLGSFGLGSTVTVYVPFLLEIGLTLSQVALVNAVFWTVLILAEVPTGALADGRGRTFSLRLGVLFEALGATLYMHASGFWSAALAESLIGVGMAFLSGVEVAWITDALHRENRTADLSNVNATKSIVHGGGMLLGGFFGTVLSLWFIQAIWLPMLVLGVANFLFISTCMNGHGEPIERVSEREAVVRSMRLLRSSRELAWILGALLVWGSVIVVNHYWTPFFEPHVGRIGLSWVWAIIYLSIMTAGMWVRRLSIPVGTEGSYIVLAIIFAGFGLIAIPLAGGLPFMLSGMIIHEFGRGMFQPLVDTFTHHRVESAYRATFGSLQSFIGRAGFAIVPLFVWFAIDGKPATSGTIGLVWTFAGISLILGAIVLFALRPKA